MHQHPPTLTLEGAISMSIYTSTNYRKIYEQHYGPIPEEANGRSYEIHHIDGNHTNNDPSNLQAVTLQEHYNIHYAQSDWSACQIMSVRMSKSPTEISELVGRASRDRVAKGIHHWQDKEEASRRNKKRIAQGNHPFIDSELQRMQGIKGGHSLARKRKTDPELDRKIKAIMSANGKKAKGSFWITNGTDTKMIKSTVIPDGWHKGRK